MAAASDFLRAVAKAPHADVEYEPTIPNQFRALVPDDFDPRCLRGQILQRWRALAGEVWDSFIAPAISHDSDQLERSRAIWEDQIGTDGDDASFWETIWVIGSADDHESRPDDLWLAERKLFRAPFFLGDVGEGDLCMMSRDFREISGWRRSSNRVQQNQFWTAVSNYLGQIDSNLRHSGQSLDLGASERLSAPALVKRLFPRLQADILARLDMIGWKPASATRWEARRKQWSGREDIGNISVRYWPSTAAIAAAPWMARAIEQKFDAECQALALSAKTISLKHAVAERQSRIWENLVHGGGDQPTRQASAAASFLALDGSLMFGDLSKLQQENEDVLDQRTALVAQKNRADFTKKLSGLQDLLGCSPAPYIAILQFDGDRMSALIGEKGSIATGMLNNFQTQLRLALSGNAQNAWGSRSAVLYGAADELVIVCPAGDALEVAHGISGIFDKVAASIVDAETEKNRRQSTISVAISIARFDYPLSRLIRGSAQLLKRTKTTCGGGGLGVEVVSLSGCVADWVGIAKSTPNASRGLTETLKQLKFLASLQPQESGLDLRTNRVIYAVSDAFRLADPFGEFAERYNEKAVYEIILAALTGAREAIKPTADQTNSHLPDVADTLMRLAIPDCRVSSQASAIALLRIIAHIELYIDHHVPVAEEKISA